ncbi:MAG: hypothetical protein FWE27_01000 [Defluviitaleaceae bacterium]|nr:hypothetical protein [Defluviitaleaceae bacterium]
MKDVKNKGRFVRKVLLSILALGFIFAPSYVLANNAVVSWGVQGAFESVTMVAGTNVTKPIDNSSLVGDIDLVDDNNVIIPNDGWYFISLGNGVATSNSPLNISYIWVNGNIITFNGWETVGASSVSTSVYLQKEDVVNFSILSLVDNTLDEGMRFAIIAINSLLPDLMNSPHLWEIGTEYKFADGSYGQRFAGTITADSNVEIETSLSSNLNSSNASIISCGGWWDFGNGYRIPIGASIGGRYHAIVGLTPLNHPGGGSLVFFTSRNSVRIDAPYDIWVRYTKH